MSCLHASITVEPLAVLTVIAVFFLLQGEQQFFSYKLCMINYNSTGLCSNLSAYPKEEDRIQTETTRWTLYMDVLCYGLSAISLLILGAWSDRVGRKPPLILVCSGGVILGAVLIISATWIHLPMPFLLVGWACFGIAGSQGILFSSMLSYIADVTSVESRLTRMGILQAFICFSSVAGTFTTGVLVNSHSFQLLFLIFTLLFLLAILYIVFCLKESRSRSPVSESLKSTHDEETDPLIRETEPLIRRETDLLIRRETECVDGATCQVPQGTNLSTSSICGELFQRETLFASFVVCARKRPGHGRVIVILLLVCAFLLNVIYYGYTTVFVLWAIKAPIKWSPFTVGLCLAFSALFNGVLLLIILPLARLARINSQPIAGVCLVLLCIGLATFGFARSTSAVWLASTSSYFFNVVLTVYSALVSTLVSPDEQGRALALMNIMASLAHLGASIIFNNLYPATLHILSGAVSFLVMCGINLVQLGLFLCVIFLPKNRNV